MRQSTIFIKAQPGAHPIVTFSDGSGYSSVPLEALRPGDYRQRLFIHTDPEEERE